MVSPCAPTLLVRGSGTSAPHWPTGGTYLHRHTELAAVISRQPATPRGEEPTPLKGTGQEVRFRPPDQRMVESWEGPEKWKPGRGVERGVAEERELLWESDTAKAGSKHWGST